MKRTFDSGRHLAAARTLAGLKQTDLAALAGLHVNSLKRLEGQERLTKGWAMEKLHAALIRKGIHCDKWPTPSIRVTDT